MPETNVADPRALFESSLELIDRVIGWSCRRMCLVDDMADDFRSWVHLRLIEDDYRVLREFSGRSQLNTFLTAVIQNLARDFRTRRWGRWRPSAMADRLGVVAVQLETLVQRDGFGFDEAVEILRRNFAVSATHRELAELAGKLPPRTSRREEGPDVLESLHSSSSADEGLDSSRRSQTVDRTRAALEKALTTIEPEDRMILKLHYLGGITIAGVARTLDLEQRSVYTRRDASLRRLATELAAAGLDPLSVLDAVGWSESRFELAIDTDEAETRDSVSLIPREKIDEERP